MKPLYISEQKERHHYMPTQYTYEPLEEIIARDKAKIELAKANSISLIVVPCWWDGQKERYKDRPTKQKIEN